MQTYAEKTKSQTGHNAFILGSVKIPDHMADLFTDKKAIYVETAIMVGDYCLVTYCPRYTLEAGAPEWVEAKIKRSELITFVIERQLNQWQSFDANNAGYVVTQNECRDAETHLLEMDDVDRHEMVRDYLEKGVVYHAAN